MKIIFLATGAANMFCGSCMRDNTLAAAMKAMGNDVTLAPLYTPMRLDEENVGEKRIFYGGIEAFLRQRFPQPSAARSVLLRLAGSQTLLRFMPRFDMGSAVDPKANAELTLSMLRGEEGRQRELLIELVTWLKRDASPDLIYVTNTLISGVAPMLKRELGVPIVCGLHGEDIFLDGLPEEYRQPAIDQIRKNCESIDHFIAISQYYADTFSSTRLGIDPAKVTLVRPGIAFDDYTGQPRPHLHQPPVIGYLARISPEKGLHLLVDAYIRLCQQDRIPGLQLRIAGYLSKVHQSYVDGLLRRLKAAGLAERVDLLGTVDRAEKRDFFQSIDIFSVPTVYRDPKGLPVLEALANGVPVVEPDHGAFPEILEQTGGGLLHRPEDSNDLAARLLELLEDDRLRFSMAQHGFAVVRSKFSAARMAQETLEVYRRAAGHPG